VNNFNDINDFYLDILKEINSCGKIKGKRKEIYFMTFSLEDMDKNVLFFPFAQRNWPWILRECSDRMFSIKNPGIAFRYSKNWENRKEVSGLFSYHYSNRLHDQMEKVFRSKIHSRDKIISIWNRSDLDLDGRRLPCTIILQLFMEDDNKMSMMCILRNNDMVNIFPSDIFIHSTYLKFWCTKYNIEYKNIYWVSAIAYYQKKRDEMKFVDRLLDQWSNNYSKLNIQPTHWDQSFLYDLQLKECFEESLRRESCTDVKLDDIKSDYIREWAKIMLLYHLKKDKRKDEFQEIIRSDWHTEFKFIKDSIISPK